MIRFTPTKPSLEKKRKRRRSQVIAVRQFQFRYAIFLGSFGLVLSVLAGGVTFYLLNHNYQLMAKAQLLTSPRMVDNLYRELKLANEILLLIYIGFVAFLALVGLRFSQRLVVPVLLIQEKMREVSRGDLVQAAVSIRKTDEFQELCETYNYMVESLRIQIKNDLARLQKLKPDDHNRDAVHTWQLLIDEKRSQLTGSSLSSPDQAPVSRHAS
jgi:methyl-accepting chemotaxis protein